MRKLIAWIARAVGIRCRYHVAARYVVDGESVGFCDMTVTVSPWIHERNFPMVRELVALKARCSSKNAIITSITRIGV